MPRRSRTTQFICVEPGCRESGFFEYNSQREYSAIHQRNEGKWRCLRHTRQESWLTPTNVTREMTLEVEQKEYGRFWKEVANGYVHGPGFNAYASEFPPGTKLVVTARVVLPGDPCSDSPKGDK